MNISPGLLNCYLSTAVVVIINTMKKLVLYGTDACHLCELAEALLNQLDPSLIRVEKEDISLSDELMERYAIRIPVLRDPETDKELGWPFELEQLLDYLESLNWN